jgi:hypothetical protein
LQKEEVEEDEDEGEDFTAEMDGVEDDEELSALETDDEKPTKKRKVC